ncbi:MAG: fibronectin type III domain-containing protein [Actinomycetota bacterium]
MHVSTARLAAFLCVGFAASSLALAAPASANSGTATLTTHNGQVGVNQVLTATYVSSDAGPSCDNEGGVVSFNFKVDNGPNLGTISGTCAPVSDGSVTPVATWTATMNWTPTKPGAQLLTTQATQQLFGGAPVVGQATKSVLIAPAVAPKPTTPSKVRNLKVTGVSTNTVSLNWDAPSDTGASAIAVYVVKWAGPTSGHVSVQANTTNANIGTLTANSSYTFSVLATNLQGWGDPVSVTQNTANTPAPAPTPPPLQQQTLVGPAWEGGGPKVKSGKWKTFNDTANLDTNAGQEARLKAKNKSASIKSVKFRYKGDFVEVRAVLKPGKKKGSFTLHESAPAVPGFTAMAVERKIKVVK